VHGQTPREIAVQTLRHPPAGADYLETRLDDALEKAALSAVDRRLCQELVFGVVRWQATLDWLIARKTEGRTQKEVLQILLRLGLYQLFWLDRVPAHAAVHETVALARRLGFGSQAGFVNAVLRGYAREAESTRRELAELKRTRPHLGFSHPEWLVARWRMRWGDDAACRLLEWNNSPPPTFARVNTLRTDAAQLVERWRAENVDYDFHRFEWTGENLVLLLKAHPPIASLGSFRDGWFYVQDPSTLLAVRVLDPRPGDHVLDLCAAPGGKTTYVAQLLQNEGGILARDNAPGRLRRLEENCRRLGVRCVSTELGGTARTPARPAGHGRFDRVLVDAPCSNTGVLRRRVDLRWRLRPTEIDRLATLQVGLLRAAAAEVRAGGILAYSTCSLEPEENSQVIRRFLADHAGFELETERDLLPFRDGVDGAYVARLRAPPAH
jgi:16S rRNA (cytosine967-C5)-methyltransferase